MTGAELIQLLMEGDNVDKEIVVSSIQDKRLHLSVEQVQDHTSLVNIQVDLDDLEKTCTREHTDDEECICDCDLCRHCEWK